MNPPATAPDFLARAGWGDAKILPLAGDASFRRYFRAVAPGRSAVLMDAPPPHEDPRPFIAVAEWLTAHGFAAPEIYARDLDLGLVLIEDFGDARMREIADAAPESELRLYEQAVDILVALAGQGPAGLAPYDPAVLHREAALVPEWYAPAVGLAVDADGFRAAWDAVFHLTLGGPRVPVLRDYHAENIMLIEHGARKGLMGLLDFQDALDGHPAYDLVSLLQDARRDVHPELEKALLDRYLRTTGAGQDFVDAYHVLGAQRNSKIVGIFTRLWQRDGKPRYPSLCPRVWRYLNHDLEQPVLAPVKAWFDANIPMEKRGDPMIVGNHL
ncbi:aminoglycoside phosphotransferase family protein [Sphingomonas sp.]|uniref:aminoglycoside phosphotransferase family protein n=1 Tax=Sphingomonas sp. TaxID=28214 RepID=UPI002CF6EAD5|nr:phosphotransferase [Sphingomonas sp.]HWK37137.1 phosphotransferase [Sphingomonas sp.]